MDLMKSLLQDRRTIAAVVTRAIFGLLTANGVDIDPEIQQSVNIILDSAILIFLRLGIKKCQT